MQFLADCYASSTELGNGTTTLSRMWGLDSLEMLASKHHLIADLSVESWPAGLQMIQKHIKGWKMGLEEDMGFLVIEAYSLPMNAMSLVGSVMTHFCGSHYPLYMSIVDTSSRRVMIDKAFSVPKCLRLFRTSHHLHQLLKKLWCAVPGQPLPIIHVDSGDV